MPRKKIVPKELRNPAGDLADMPGVKEKPRKAGAKTAASANRVRGKKAASAATKLSEEAAANQGAAAILGAAVSEEEQVALLAYSYWEARGRQGGSPQEDWYRAVREFRSRVG